MRGMLFDSAQVMALPDAGRAGDARGVTSRVLLLPQKRLCWGIFNLQSEVCRLVRKRGNVECVCERYRYREW